MHKQARQKLLPYLQLETSLVHKKDGKGSYKFFPSYFMVSDRKILQKFHILFLYNEVSLFDFQSKDNVMNKEKC